MPLSQKEIERLKRKISIQRSIPLPPFRRFNASIFDTAGCVYIHIPKTAGTSIRNTLAALPNPNRRRYPRLRKHARAFEYRAAIGENLWQQYFSFAFVRNPFDLMVSSYFWWLEKSHKFRKLNRLRAEVENMPGFNTFIASRFGREYVNEYPGDLFDWISEGGEVIVDFVGRVENLNDDWKTICKQIGIPAVELPHVNRTSRGNYREYYQQRSVDLVAQRFHKTIEMFGYEF